MSRFTEHIRTLDANSFPDLGFLEALASELRNRIKRRDLWGEPPKFLGYPDCPTWETAFRDEPLPAVLWDCYEFAVIRRLGSLRRALKRCENIDGYVSLNVEHFVHGRQKKNDPIGYAVFTNVRATCLLAIASGVIRAVGIEGEYIPPDTVLAFSDAAPAARPAAQSTIEEAVAASTEWNEIIPRLRSNSVRVQQLLLDCLDKLKDAGIQAFRLNDLANLLKEPVRAVERLPALQTNSQVVDRSEDQPIGEIIRTVLPDRGYENHEHYKWQLQRIRDAIQGLDCQERVRTRALRLFDELVRLSESDEEIPSGRELARCLGIASSTFGDAMAVLKRAFRAVIRSTERPAN